MTYEPRCCFCGAPGDPSTLFRIDREQPSMFRCRIGAGCDARMRKQGLVPVSEVENSGAGVVLLKRLVALGVG